MLELHKKRTNRTQYVKMSLTNLNFVKHDNYE